MDNTSLTFPTNAHRIAWYLGASLLPYQPFIPHRTTELERKALAKGQAALHAFFSSLYADMYEHPDAFGMTGLADTTFEDGQWYKHRPDMKKTWLRNAHVMKSLEVLFNVVAKARESNGSLVLKAGEFQALLDDVTPKSVSRPKIKGFLSALSRSGLDVAVDDGILITAAPELIRVLRAMARFAGGEDHDVRFFAFYRCDFTGLEEQYTPDIGGVLQILSDANRTEAERIIEHLSDSGYEPVFRTGGYPSALWRITYSGRKQLKAGDFFWLSFSIEYLNRFSLNLHCINPMHLIPVAREKGDGYLSWFSENWRQGCNGCGYCKGKFKEPGPYVIEVQGKKRGLCHQNWMGVRNPDRASADNMLRMVDLHTEAGMLSKRD